MTKIVSPGTGMLAGALGSGRQLSRSAFEWCFPAL